MNYRFRIASKARTNLSLLSSSCC